MINYNNQFNLVPADGATGVYEIPELDGLPYDVVTGADMYTDASNHATYATGHFVCGNSHSPLSSADRQLARDVN